MELDELKPSWMAEADPVAGMLPGWMREEQEAKLKQAREEWAPKRMGERKELFGVTVDDITSRLAGGITQFSRGRDYQKAEEAYQKGTATDEQLGIKAEHELKQQREENDSGSRKFARTVARTPGFVLESLLGGAAVRGTLGATGAGAKLLATPAGATAPLLSRAGAGAALKMAGQSAAVQAAATPITPQTYLPQSQERAIRNGGSFLDAENMVPAMAEAIVSNAALGSAGQFAGRVGSGVPTMAGRLGTRSAVGAVAMPAEQQAADALVSRISEEVGEKYKVETKYGVIGSFLRGDNAKGWEALTHQALLGAGFAAMHGNKARPVEKLAEAIDAGVKPAEVAEAVRNPDSAKGPVKEFVESLQEAQRVSEKPTDDASLADLAQSRLTPEQIAADPAASFKRQTQADLPETAQEVVRTEIVSESAPQAAHRMTGVVPMSEVRRPNPAESHAAEKFGADNTFRTEVKGPTGEVVGEATLAKEMTDAGLVIHVPWTAAKGLAGGEGRGVEPLGRKAMFDLAEQIAREIPDAKVVKFQPSAGRIGVGVHKVFDLDKIRERVAKKEAAEPKPEPVQPGVEQKTAPDKPPEAAKPTVLTKLRETADRWEQEALADFKKLGGGEMPFSGFDPAIIVPLAKYTAAKIIKGGLNFADFSKGMVSKYGDGVKPHIDDIWGKAQAHVKEAGGEPEPTSIKNERTAQEREKRGIPPVLEADPVGHTFPELREQVLEAVQKDPGRTARLVEDLQKNPRAVSDLEDAMLLHRQVELQNQYDGAIKQAESAKQSGDPVATAEAENARLAIWGQLKGIYDVNKAVGTEQGRGLAARRMLMRQDFSLARMEARMQDVKGELTEKDRSEVVESQRKITEAAGKADAAEAIARRKRVEKIIGTQPTERTSKAMKEVDAAWDRLQKVTKGKLFSTPFDPELLSATVGLSKAYVKLGVAKFSDFVAAIRQRSGKPLAPESEELLQKGWNAAQQELAAERVQLAGERMKGLDPKDLGAIGRFAQSLYKDFAQSGLDGMDPRIDAVHAELQKIIPGITRDQAMDAISGYGVYKTLSKEQLEAEIRDQKGQMQQLAKLRDMEAKEPPKKTGVERRVPSAAERELLRKVNEKKKELGYDVTDPETQLKTTLDAAKTRMKNQIEDMTRQIQKGERSVAERKPLTPDAELAALTTRRDALREQYDAVFAKPGMTDAQRLKIATEATQKSIAEYERRIKEKDFARNQGKKVSSDELDALKARREALAEEFQELRDSDPAVQAEKNAKATAKEAERIKESISEYDRKLEMGEFFPKPEPGKPVPPEIAELRAKLDLARKSFEIGKKVSPEGQARALADAEASVRSRLETVQKAIDTGEASPANPGGRTTAELAKLRAELKALNGTLEALRAGPKKSADEIADQRLRAFYASKIAERKEKIAAGDFTKPEKVTRTESDELRTSKAEYQKTVAEWEKLLEQKQREGESRAAKILRGAGDIIDFQRAFKLGFDLPPIFRQGGFVTLSHPILSGKSFKESAESLKSPLAASKNLVELQERENNKSGAYKRNMNLDLSDMRIQDEFARSSIAERIPGLSHLQRWHSNYLTRLRADLYDTMTASMIRSGKPTEAEGQIVGNAVNAFTGRGSVIEMGQAAGVLNKVFLAPSWVLSRFKVALGQPLWYGLRKHGLQPRARVAVAKEYVRAAASAASIYKLAGLAVAAGLATIENDPRSTDFGEIKIGNTRTNPLFGLTQVYRLIGQLLTGEKKDTETKQIRAVGFGQTLGDETRKKFSPALQQTVVGAELARKATGLGKGPPKPYPQTPKEWALEFIEPLTEEDFRKAVVDLGLGKGFLVGLFASLGGGVKVYDKK